MMETVRTCNIERESVLKNSTLVTLKQNVPHQVLPNTIFFMIVPNLYTGIQMKEISSGILQLFKIDDKSLFTCWLFFLKRFY